MPRERARHSGAALHARHVLWDVCLAHDGRQVCPLWAATEGLHETQVSVNIINIKMYKIKIIIIQHTDKIDLAVTTIIM